MEDRPTRLFRVSDEVASCYYIPAANTAT